MASTPPLTRRQRDILEFLREYVESEGIAPTLDEIAAHFGVNKVTVFGHVAELERKGVLRRRAKGASRSLELIDDDEASGPGVLPLLGRIAAGTGIEEIEDADQFDLASLIPPGRDVFALTVQGESMIEDAIADGDVVFVERRETARNGETVVAVLPSGDVTLKRFYREKDHVRLQPANSTMAPILVNGDVAIRGVVVGVVRRC